VVLTATVAQIDRADEIAIWLLVTYEWSILCQSERSFVLILLAR